MDLLTIFLLAVGLSMDAFAVSVCKGLAISGITWGKCFMVGGWFGCFQALMPMTGYFLGIRFETYIDAVAPWVAFILLLFIGGNMIYETISGEHPEEENSTLAPREMLILSVATSIDALAAGITYACIPVSLNASIGRTANTLAACALTGIITFLISVTGVRIGNIFGNRYEKRAQLAGGIILILLGVKILLEHFWK